LFLFKEVYALVKEHIFSLDRFIWAYPVESIGYKKLNKYWEGYVDNLRTWDIESHKYKTLLDMYYDKTLAKEFSEVAKKFKKAREEVRYYWRECAIKKCTWNKRKNTLGPTKEKRIDQCIQKGTIKNIKKKTIQAYIKCIVADARNAVTRFSKKLAKAHRKLLQQSKVDEN